MSHAAIVEFLIRRFTAEELRRFIGFKYPDVVATLPGASASAVEVVDASVAMLGRLGRLDAAFFAYLREARDRFVPEIDELERSSGATTTRAEQPTRKPRSPAPSRSEPAGGVAQKPGEREKTRMSKTTAAPAKEVKDRSKPDTEVEVEGPVDVLLVTTADVEWKAVVEAARKATGRKYKVSVAGRPYYDLGVIGGARVVMTQCRMGSGTPGGSQSAVTQAIFERDLKAGPAGTAATVIAVGIAFGVNPEKQEIGRVLVSTYVRSYDPERVGRSEIIPRGARAPASTQVVDRLQVAANECKVFKTEFGLLLSGEKLVDNLDYRNSLRKLEQEAVGGEMEGVGILTAAHDNMVAWAVVKAICDWGDGNKGEDKEERQRIAARNAAALVFNTLKNGGFSRGSAGAQPKQGRSSANSETTIASPPRPPRRAKVGAGPGDPGARQVAEAGAGPGGEAPPGSSGPWEIEARVIEILRNGPVALAERLDARITWPTKAPAEAVGMDAVQRVARKLHLLGPGHAPAKALVEHGWGATGQVKKEAPSDHEAALTTLQKLVSMWMPRGYSEGRMLFVRRSSAPDAIEDLEVRTVSPVIAEHLTSSADGKDSTLVVRPRTGETGQAPSAIVGLGSIAVPVSQSQLRPPRAVAEEIADHIAGQINVEHRSEPTQRRKLARATLHNARKDKDSGDYCPWYLVVRGEDQDRGVTREVISLLKGDDMLPSLRVVELMREPGSGQQGPPCLDEDNDLLYWLHKIFGGSSDKSGSTR